MTEKMVQFWVYLHTLGFAHSDSTRISVSNCPSVFGAVHQRCVTRGWSYLVLVWRRVTSAGIESDSKPVLDAVVKRMITYCKMID